MRARPRVSGRADAKGRDLSDDDRAGDLYGFILRGYGLQGRCILVAMMGCLVSSAAMVKDHLIAKQGSQTGPVVRVEQWTSGSSFY